MIFNIMDDVFVCQSRESFPLPNNSFIYILLFIWNPINTYISELKYIGLSGGSYYRSELLLGFHSNYLWNWFYQQIDGIFDKITKKTFNKSLITRLKTLRKLSENQTKENKKYLMKTNSITDWTSLSIITIKRNFRFRNSFVVRRAQTTHIKRTKVMHKNIYLNIRWMSRM